MHGYKIPTIFKTVLTTIFILWIIIPKVFAEELQIIVLVSHNESPYADVLAGFQEYIKEQKMPAKCDVYTLESEKIQLSQIFQNIKNNKINLLFTIGTIPTEEALKVFIDVPIVATLILDKRTIRHASNATGVI